MRAEDERQVMMKLGLGYLEDHLDLGVKRLDAATGEVVSRGEADPVNPDREWKLRRQKSRDPAGIVGLTARQRLPARVASPARAPDSKAEQRACPAWCPRT